MSYGPADVNLLRQWVAEGRVQAGTTVRDAATGQTMPASSVPDLFPSVYGSGAPVPGYAYVPRSDAGVKSNDLTVAWVLTGAAIVSALCVWSIIGLALAIVGMIFAKRAGAGGDPRAQAPLFASYAAIGLSAVMLVLNIIGIMSLQF